MESIWLQSICVHEKFDRTINFMHEADEQSTIFLFEAFPFRK